MALEVSFGVELTDEEIAGMVTPRIAGDLIFSKLKSTDENVCQSQRVFYLLRNVFLKSFGLRRTDVTLETPLREFIPRAQEREVWPQLQTAVAARTWPELERPIWMCRLLTANGLAILAAIIFASLQFSLGLNAGVILGLTAALLFGGLAIRLTIPSKVCIPAALTTIRDLVPFALTSDRVAWNREQVSARIRQIVMEELEVPESEYTEELHFIEDCGVA